MRRPLLCAVSAVLAVAVASFSLTNASAASWTTTRVAGANRFDTAVQVSKTFFSSTASTVVLANGTKFADSLSGSALAAKLDGPLLLVQQNSLPTEVAAELERLKPTRVIVLGGTAAVANSVLDDVKKVVTTDITRLAGATRYETSAAITAHGWPNGAKTVYVTTGEGYPAGLLAGAAAGLEGLPVLITPPASVPSPILNELKRLAPTTVRAVTYGTTGDGYISPAALNQIETASTGVFSTVTGTDLFDVSITLAGITGRVSSAAILTTSEAFPDALAAGAAASIAKQSLLMTRRDCMPDKVSAFITTNRMNALTVVGGTAAISEASSLGEVCLTGVQAGQDWETAPLPTGVSKADIDSAVTTAFGGTTNKDRVRSLLVTIGDKIVYERYHPLDNVSTVMSTNSVSKSIVGAIIGLLVGDGLLSLDQKAPVTAWGSASDPRNKITIRNLLQMRSGLTSDGQPVGANGQLSPLLKASDVFGYATSQPLATEPGSEWAYTSIETAILMGIATDTLGGITKTDAYLKSRLLDPLGIKSATFQRDLTGRIKGFMGIHMTTRDLARFGLLYLNSGTWGRTQVLSSDWTAFSTTRSTEAKSSVGGQFAAHWWTFKDYYYAIGFGGNWIVVVPPKNMVMVITTASLTDGVSTGNQGTRSYDLRNRIYDLFPYVKQTG